MEIQDGTFEKILDDRNAFCNFFCGYVVEVFGEARLTPQFSLSRIEDIYGAWRNDLSRVGNHEPKIEEGLDHFKRSAHLAFWIRRFSPVIALHDNRLNLGDAEGYGPTAAELKFRDLLYGGSNEYLAFDLALQFCLHYEQHKEDAVDLSQFRIDQEYVEMMCHFLKFKSVSPHSIYVILKSLFLNR
jgi:hypothetical protein